MARYRALTGSAACPVCQQHVALAESCVNGAAYREAWQSTFESRVERIKAGLETDWACGNCIRAERAVQANWKLQQVYGFDMYPARNLMCYRSKTLRCKACKADFEFTPQDQQFWYETARLYLGITPGMCLPCRRRNRASRQTSDRIKVLLAQLKTHEYVSALKELEALYLAIGRPERAGMVRQRAMTARQRQEVELQRLTAVRDLKNLAHIEAICVLQESLGLADTPEGHAMAKQRRMLLRIRRATSEDKTS